MSRKPIDKGSLTHKNNRKPGKWRRWDKEDRLIFNTILKDLSDHPTVLRMKDYKQHGMTSTYDHCISVARVSYKLDRLLHSHCDRGALLRGALLHDLFLYDWHDPTTHEGLHGYRHADSALKNAIEHFNIGRKEQDIIHSHMWPLNITRIPKRREAWVVCMADKYVSLGETLHRR